jgi:hypothetical protein
MRSAGVGRWQHTGEGRGQRAGVRGGGWGTKECGGREGGEKAWGPLVLVRLESEI